MAEPLVSVGIPTFNRAAKLARAAESVLAQTHRHLELVISDNASCDDTESLCRAISERDTRVRYLRSEVNRGPTANFNTLFGELRGDYVMLLSDDDWLDNDYLAVCLEELTRRSGFVLVCGKARYLRGSHVVREGVNMQLDSDSPTRRVLSYLRNVDENGMFYGLMARSALKRAAPLGNVLGNDWLFVAALAAQGKIATVTSTTVNRELEGTSANFAKIAATLGLPAWQARVPHLVIAWETVRDVAGGASAYRELGLLARWRLVLLAPLAAIRWRSLAWHVTMPTFAALERRASTRWLWRAYDRVTRLLGAGRSDPGRSDQ
jgi:glycosyltransferase involved in cell wall biosynthesis